MKFRGLIVAIVVLLALSGVLYWSNHRKPAESSSTASSTTSPAILKLDRAGISQITLTRRGTPPVTLTRDAAHNWRITEPKPLNADQDAVSSLLGTVSTLNSDRVIEEKASDLKPYGLDQPADTVDITARDGTRKLLIGDETPAGQDVYALLQGDPKVYTIANDNKTSIDKGLNDLRDKRLVTIEPDKVSRIELRAKGQDMAFARIKDGWQIEKPKALRADGPAVDALVRSVCNARMDLGTSGDDHAAADFAHAAPLATVVLTGDQGPQTLEVRKNKTDYYAKTTAAEGDYKTENSIGSELDKGLDDFRSKKLFDFGFQDPNKIELHAGVRSWFLTRSGADWWSNGKKMDPAAVDSLLEKLRDLTATGFPDSGFDSPAFEATVTSNDGKRVEKVLISKSGEKTIGRRENEPALYELPPNSIRELTTAADGLKPR
jgi:hypothetical protein